MRSLSNDFRKYFMYFVFSFLAVGITSCSSDDDADDIMNATGTIIVEDNQTISQDNTITIQNITVGQDSWIVAVMAGDENTNNFISDPVRLTQGTNEDVELTLNEDANLMSGETGNEISLVLYADDGNSMGQWDESDGPIMGSDGTLSTETITVFVQDGMRSFAELDENADGMLDENEFPNSYQNNFSVWDTDGDGNLNDEEFSNTTFGNTDADDDNVVSQEEFNLGRTGQFGNYAGEDDFTNFDTNADGSLDSNEWRTGFGGTEWFNTYDADASTDISEDEWNTGVMGDWDADGDGMINEDEYNTYGPYTSRW